ncbi:F-box/LRR-repeat protein 14 [Nematostella vectensis]|uniref:F-box/LRR-repeat protein 14 n=1 Tax=Nematostella vectensis TaxID=45351 RepID=UPI0020778DE7|nr:F-box/LRR-repeat protein 14 [Nematostella vectensis]
MKGQFEMTIHCLFPEILALIFAYLSVRDKGRVAQVCTKWRDAAYSRIVWRGVQARLHLRRSNPFLFPSLAKRGIRKIRILSLKKSLSFVVQSLSCIESLNLKGCYNVTDTSIGHAFVKYLPTLTVLDLSLCKQITDSSLGKIADFLKNLEFLDLAGCCNITNTGLLLCSWGLVKLKHLNLRSCRHISDAGILHLSGLSNNINAHGNKNLTTLCLQDCQKITDNALRHISKGLINLECLNLSFCCGISGAGLAHLATLRSLRELNLRSCEGVNNEGIAHLAVGGLNLVCLDVSFCDKIGDVALNHISSGLNHLQNLGLNSSHITDQGLCKISRHLRELRVLNIGQCTQITDQSIASIASNLICITNIDLYGCTKVTKCGLEKLMHLPKLRVLNLGLWQR